VNPDFRDLLRAFADAESAASSWALIEDERRLGRARDLADLELLERHRREE
jgi:hypothetical protein